MKKYSKNILILLGILFILNFAGYFIFKRFDLTADKRYTLSNTSLKIVKNIKDPLYIDVYLDGNFPGEFKKLQNETKQLLDEFKAYNSNIIYQFSNPLENVDNQEQTMNEFYQKGMLPINITVDDKGKQTQEAVFPWALISYKDKKVKVPLLKNMMGVSTAQKVNSSVQHLEYAFVNALNTAITTKTKKVAIIKGNGELHDQLIADFLKTVRENYFIAPFTLDSVAKNPVKTTAELNKYDLAVIAKPTETFTDEEKQVLDQFTINGGKSIYLIDQVAMDMDSLMTTGESLAIPRNLNLDDLFFKYGVRIKPDLVKDLQAAPIAIATGQQGSATQYTQFPWLFDPVVFPDVKNPITNNLDVIKLEFANPMEILKNDIKKTVLLQSSPYSKSIGTPVMVNLNMVGDQPKETDFNPKNGNMPMAVLLEGKFTSVYANRILPFKDNTFIPQGKNGKMIVISDGDMIRNQLDKNFQPLELGYDKWTNKLYANKEFMMNCVNYLLDDNGLINLRNKEVNLPLLDANKVHENYTQTQIITIAIPIMLLAIFGAVFTYLRRKKYSSNN